MNVNDKIKQILIAKSLSPSHFADEIGVQRSSISHILSGRNRPSFDIIQKIIRRFPDLGFDWIMEEGGESSSDFDLPTGNETRRPQPPSSAEQRAPFHQRSVPLPSSSLPSQVPARSTMAKPHQVVPRESTTNETTLTEVTDRRVERILIFYSDGTFKEFLPTP